MYIYINIHTHIAQKQETYCLWSKKWFIKSFSNFEICNTVTVYLSLYDTYLSQIKQD